MSRILLNLSWKEGGDSFTCSVVGQGCEPRVPRPSHRTRGVVWFSECRKRPSGAVPPGRCGHWKRWPAGSWNSEAAHEWARDHVPDSGLRSPCLQRERGRFGVRGTGQRGAITNGLVVFETRCRSLVAVARSAAVCIPRGLSQTDQKTAGDCIDRSLFGKASGCG